MFAAILLAEATLLPIGVDLSIFSILIYSVKKQEVLVQRWGTLMMLSLFLEKDSTIFIHLSWLYILLVASNFFDCVVGFFGNWKRLRFQIEADDMDGFDSSRLIILQKERSWLEQGCKVGEQVIPLARNFNGADIESGKDMTDCMVVEMKATTSSIDGVKGSPLRHSKKETHKYGTSRDAISNKNTMIIKEQSQHVSNQKTVQNNIIIGSHLATIRDCQPLDWPQHDDR